jgi:hypothetical protein
MKRARSLAWLVFAALLIVPPAVTIRNLIRLEGTRLARDAAVISAEALTRRAAASHPESGAVAAAAGLFFETASVPMTAAALQNQVSGIIAASGATLDEFEHLEVPAADLPFAAAELRVSFRATIAALQETLYRIEQGYPAVIVETLDVRSDREGAEDPYSEPELRIVLTVRGFSEGTS